MLVRTRPFRPASHSTFDQAFDQLSRSFFTQPNRRTPSVDAAWTDGSLVLTVDLPGTPADAVDVSVAGRTLTISAGAEGQSWERSVRLGAALDAELVSARYLDGRLTVTVAPVAAAEARRIDVSTEPPASADSAIESGEGQGAATSDNG